MSATTRTLRTVRFVVACATLLASVSLSAQAPTPPDAKTLPPLPQGFSVVLVLGEGQGTTVADNVPAAARKALADMKDFLPYRGYRLLDAAWILGSQRSTSRLRGPDDQEYQLTVATTQVAGGKIQIRYQMQESSPMTMVAPRDADEAAVRKTLEAELQSRLERLQASLGPMRQRLGDKHPDVAAVAAEIENLKMRLAGSEAGDGRTPRAILGGRSVIDTTFTMDVGETVVVGTSRVRGGDKALIALLTAVPRGGAAPKKE